MQYLPSSSSVSLKQSSKDAGFLDLTRVHFPGIPGKQKQKQQQQRWQNLFWKNFPNLTVCMVFTAIAQLHVLFIYFICIKFRLKSRISEQLKTLRLNQIKLISKKNTEKNSPQTCKHWTFSEHMAAFSSSRQEIGTKLNQAQLWMRLLLPLCFSRLCGCLKAGLCYKHQLRLKAPVLIKW